MSAGSGGVVGKAGNGLGGELGTEEPRPARPSPGATKGQSKATSTKDTPTAAAATISHLVLDRSNIRFVELELELEVAG